MDYPRGFRMPAAQQKEEQQPQPNAIPDEQIGGIPAQIPEQEVNRQIPAHRRGQRGRRQGGEPRPTRTVFQEVPQLEEPGRADRRNPEQEGEARRRLAGETQEHRRGHRRARPGRPGDQGHRLRKPDQLAVQPPDLVHLTPERRRPLGPPQHDPQEDQTGGDHIQRAPLPFDVFLEGQPA